MPTIASRFKFEYFPSGADYSAKSDFQRFVTLDYNMKSYIGVIGIGVIDGWEIEQTTDTEIQILPGTGIINGFFAESPYTLKRRSDMVSGEREAAVVKLQESAEEDMTDAEADAYEAIIQEYDPTFNPTRPIENAWIKAVTPEKIVLPNDSDLYVWVTREHSNYYPDLGDYPPYLVPEPNINDYLSYDEYLVAESAYTAQMDAIYGYNFRDDSSNHFTVVDFNIASTFIGGPTKVLLGVITTRDNEVINIDTSAVTTVKHLESTINDYAHKVVNRHIHGGDENFDPPRVNLETDIRQAVLTSYSSESRRGNFSVVESQLTSTTDGHSHTFTIDSDGNGQTVGIIGASDNHYHKIVEETMQVQEVTDGNVDDHQHDLPNLDNFEWTDDSEYVVYVNGVAVGDDTSDNISVTPSSKKLSLTGIIGGITKTYGMDFEYEGKRFTFSEQQSGAYRFMLSAITEFNSQFPTSDLSTNPFVFYDEETQTVAGLNDIKEQSVTAEALLRKAGDTFVYTPDAARNIKVTLLDYQRTVGLEADLVTIEILGNSEVRGILRPENIFFVNAQKVVTGVFEISQIPFLSHIGRTNESFSSFNYPLISQNGFDFQVTPAITTTSFGHYHNLLLNEKSNGVVENTFVDDDPVYYEIGGEGDIYLVAHLHTVSNGEIDSAESAGLLDWQNDINETSEESSEHTHEIVHPVMGDVKIAYSMFEDRFGNLYVGTSDDLIMIPINDAFVFVINDIPFYETGTDLLEMFENAKLNYENQTGLPLKISSDVYTVQIALAETALVNTGDSYLIVGKSQPNSDHDTTMIQKLSYVPVPNYKSSEIKNLEEVADDETIAEIQLRSTSTGALLDPDDEDVKALIAEDPTAVTQVAKVEKYFDVIPASSIEVQEITKKGVTNDQILTVGGNTLPINDAIRRTKNIITSQY